jgi:phosphoribosylglycinamide formyltransferase-1
VQDNRERNVPNLADRSSLPIIAVCLSGTGRTLRNLLDESAAGRLHARVGVVVSSVPGVGGLAIAREAGIPSLVLRRRDFDSDLEYTGAILNAIAPYDPSLIVLAGFLRKLVVTPEWNRRIVNIHPALLPEMAAASGPGFYGDRVHEAVLASGSTVSGATVHLVDNDYDTGPVLMRRTVPVLPGDTVRSLADRVFEAEKRLYPDAINHYLRQIISQTRNP